MQSRLGDCARWRYWLMLNLSLPFSILCLNPSDLRGVNMPVHLLRNHHIGYIYQTIKLFVSLLCHGATVMEQPMGILKMIGPLFQGAIHRQCRISSINSSPLHWFNQSLSLSTFHSWICGQPPPKNSNNKYKWQWRGSPQRKAPNSVCLCSWSTPRAISKPNGFWQFGP